MKKIKITSFCFLIIALFSSCMGVETPRLTKSNPFIVSKVKVYDLDNNAYTGGRYVAMFSQFWSYHQTIIAPRGMYNVGDTIKVCK